MPASSSAPPPSSSTAPAAPTTPATSGGGTTSRHAPSTVSALARLYPFARPALPRLVAGMVAALCASLAALAIPRVLERVVNGPLAAGAAEHDTGALAGAVALVAGLGLLEAMFIAVRRGFVMLPGTHVEARMRDALYRHLLELPVAFHDRWAGGQLLSRSMSDLGLLRRWLVFGLPTLVVSTTTILVGVSILIVTGGVLGLVYLAGAIPVTVIAFRFSRRFRAISRLSQDQSGDLATTVEESVHGIRVLKAFGRGRDALDAFTDQADRLRRTEMAKASTQSTVTSALTAIPELTLGVALVVGVVQAANGQISVGALVAFFATAAVVNTPVVDLGMTLSMTLNARTAVDRYFEVLDTPNTLTDPAAPTHLDSPRGDVELRDVTFRYDDAPDAVLDHVDLTLPAGTTTALVGLTGSGKSTLAMLVPRLYDVTDGSVLLDDVDVRDLARHELRTHVAVAFEDSTLFSASVRDNVLLGAPEGLDPPAREALLAEALDVAQAAFVHDLPHGVDTTIGEEGLSLSGGQRQRLALARAIAARPRVLVLDDPLSALDVATEEAVEKRLRQVLAGTTSLVVAHRPSTVALADRVAVLQDGRITAVGTHHDLLTHDPHYRHVISNLEADAAAHGLGEHDDEPAPAPGRTEHA